MALLYKEKGEINLPGISEDIRIKKFSKRLNDKVKAFESILKVSVNDASCLKGPGPNAEYRSISQHHKNIDPKKFFNLPLDEITKRLDGVTYFGPKKETKQPSRLEMSFVPPDVDLKTVHLRRKMASHTTVIKPKVKYGNAEMHVKEMFNTKCKKQPDLVPNQTLVAVVRFYKPYRHQCNDVKFDQEVVILGHQTLAQLRDLIYCPLDYISEEMSKNPSQRVRLKAKNAYKSGFLFINKTFYNDMRDPKNIDCSEIIREWAIKKKVSTFKKSLAETTKINDLTIRMGYPYVYQHQGNCEHLFTICDLRLLLGTESRISSKYPYVKCHSQRRVHYCTLCSHVISTWVVENNPRLPFNPAYFCDVCYFSFNYIDGKKVGEFRAYQLTN